MEELKKLIKILERNDKSLESTLLNYEDGSNLEIKLYRLIKHNYFEDEIQLTKQIYGTADKVSAYRMLKSRLKSKLYKHVTLLEFNSLNFEYKVNASELKCTRILFLADLFKKLGEVKLAKQQILKVLAIAEDLQMTQIQVNALEQMRVILAENEFDRRGFEKCVSELDQLYKLQEIERQTDALYFDIRFNIKLGVEANYKFLGKLTDNVNKLHSFWKESGLNSVFVKYHKLKLMLYEVTGDATSQINYIKEAFELYKAGKIHPSYFSNNYNSFLLVFSYLKAQRYLEGLLEAEKLKLNLDRENNNWFAHMENYFLLAVHSKNYQKAGELLTEVFTNKHLKNRNQFSQERWAIYYKSLNYISGFAIPIEPDLKLKHVTQDRKGFNVWNLILDFIFILDKKETELIEREIDRVRKFISKYLGAKEDARTKLFLKMLQVAGREYENSKACKRKGSYLFNKLQQTPAPGIAYAETEIIPYEHLWELILQRLENNK